MEQTHTDECHGNSVFVAGLYHVVVAHRTACLGDVLHTALMGSLDVVAEGEEGIAAQ